MIRRQITANIIINRSKTYFRKTLLFLIKRHKVRVVAMAHFGTFGTVTPILIIGFG